MIRFKNGDAYLPYIDVQVEVLVPKRKNVDHQPYRRRKRARAKRQVGGLQGLCSL